MQAIQERPAVRDGRHDFDFLFGKWKGKQRRLRERLKGSTDWEEFTSTSWAIPILGGLGTVDEVMMEREHGTVRGATMRLYDATSGQWSIFWADGVHATLDYPLIGEFKDGIGTFYGYEPFEGRWIFTRFFWSNISATTARWEQAFSEDGGVSWETNWVMDFERVE